MTTRTTPTPDSPTLPEVMEHLGWVHHVGDAATGELLTTQLDRPIAPLSRAERLFRLGHQFDPTIFGSPTHRLTPVHPFQLSPGGSLRINRAHEVWALGPDYGHARWIFRDIDSGGADLTAILHDVPAGRCLLTLQCLTANVPGIVGRLRITLETMSGEVASFGAAVHGDGYQSNTIDLVFVSVPAPGGLWVRMVPDSGLADVFFDVLTLAPLRPDIGPARA